MRWPDTMLEYDTRDATRRTDRPPCSSARQGLGQRLEMGSQRGLVQRLERKLEATVGDAFARMFGGSIVPQEVEALLRREAADGVQSLQGNRLLAPNEYIITLSVHDFDKLGADPELTSNA